MALKNIFKRFDRSNNITKTFILVLMLALVLALIVSFTDLIPLSVVNVDGKDKFVAGETQTFQISLKTVDPEQFTTDTHFREQYGRWRIVDKSGNVVSGGHVTQITEGLYNQMITIEIPKEGGTFISEIVEYQFSSLDGINFIRDDGTIRESSEIPLDLNTCSVDADCGSANVCSTKTVSCTDGVCISLGECLTCESTSECSTGEECIQDKCFKIPGTSSQAEFREAIANPITSTGSEVDGTPVPKTAPLYMIWIMLIMWGVLIFLYFQLKKRGGLKRR